jgi:hypothetical protein
MSHFKCILTSVICLITLNSFSQNSSNFIDSLFDNKGEQYFSFKNSPAINLSKISKLVSIDHQSNAHTIFAYANKKQFISFTSLEIEYELLLDKVDIPIQNNSRSTWNYYPTYQEYENMMQAFADSFPSICKLHNLGTLTSGHKILAVQISDNVGILEDEPSFLYTSSMHGNELTGYVLMLRLIDDILNGYSNGNYLGIVNEIDLWINPLANPDGAYAAGDQSVNGATRNNANWVDLNRNYPDPQDGQHPDGNVWQEETVIFMNLADSIHFSMSCNFHTGAEVFNYPWDTWSNLTADNNWWQDLGSMYADTVHQYGTPGYFNDLNNGTTNGWDWYEVDGGRQDFMNYFKLCREATIELSNVKTPNPTQLPNFWNINKASLVNYIKQSLYGVRGIVTDSITGLPLRSRVEIFGHDYDSSHVYSHLPIGNYHRPINEGNYLIDFSCTGYQTKSINVDVYSANSTVLNVQLVPNSFVGIETLKQHKKLINEVDVLGREGGDNNIKIKIFNDGSSKKIINLKHN